MASIRFSKWDKPSVHCTNFSDFALHVKGIKATYLGYSCWKSFSFTPPSHGNGRHHHHHHHHNNNNNNNSNDNNNNTNNTSSSSRNKNNDNSNNVQVAALSHNPKCRTGKDRALDLSQP